SFLPRPHTQQPYRAELSQNSCFGLLRRTTTTVSQLLGSCMLQGQYGKCLLRPPDCLSQGDFRPAETHRNPGSDELQHELAGGTTIIRQVIGELDADAPLFCHDSHFKWRRACRKTVSEHRQPVPFGEVEEHCRIAARGKDPSSRGI